MDYPALIGEALAARELSWSPYSGFMVGAALLTASGKIFRGCNIENAAFTPTSCAERTAFCTAVSQGERNFAAIAIVGGLKGGDPVELTYPCGVCRQVMMEFCDPSSFQVIVAASVEDYKVYSLEQLLPHGFGAGALDL